MAARTPRVPRQPGSLPGAFGTPTPPDDEFARAQERMDAEVPEPENLGVADDETRAEDEANSRGGYEELPPGEPGGYFDGQPDPVLEQEIREDVRGILDEPDPIAEQEAVEAARDETHYVGDGHDHAPLESTEREPLRGSEEPAAAEPETLTLRSPFEEDVDDVLTNLVIGEIDLETARTEITALHGTHLEREVREAFDHTLQAPARRPRTLEEAKDLTGLPAAEAAAAMGRTERAQP